MKMKASEIYNEQYFTTKSNYSGYRFDELYPYFSYIAKGLVKVFNPTNVLDIGCAKGFLVYALQEQGIDAYGVDVSEYAIANAPKEVAGALMLADGEQHNLPFQDASFDLILLLDVIEHLHSHNHLLSEIYRILKPHGICCLKTPILGSKQDKNDITHINVHSIGFWIKAFRDCGFLFGDNRFLINESWIKYYQSSKPSTKTARFLIKLGNGGKAARKKLIGISTYLAIKDTVFVLERGL